MSLSHASSLAATASGTNTSQTAVKVTHSIYCQYHRNQMGKCSVYHNSSYNIFSKDTKQMPENKNSWGSLLQTASKITEKEQPFCNIYYSTICQL